MEEWLLDLPNKLKGSDFFYWFTLSILSDIN